MFKTASKYHNIHQLLKKTASDSAGWNLAQISSIQRGGILAFLNAHALNTAFRNSVFGDTLMSSMALLRDGIGIKLAMQVFGLPVGVNLNGTDLITQILDQLKDQRIVIYGSSIETLEETRKRLEQRGITRIIDMRHGFHSLDYYVTTAGQTQPDVVLLCMGMPKQELLAAEIHVACPNALVICGGGWADFFSETKKRAPIWMRQMSMEWLFRLMHEPKRLGKRYTVDIVYFFYILLVSRIFSAKT